MNKEQRLRGLRNQEKRLQRRLANLNKLSSRYSWLRIAVVTLGALGAITGYHFVGFSALLACVAATGAFFAVLAVLHRKVSTSILCHTVWIQIKSAHLARATLDWERIPASFGFRPRLEHPFEIDLDIVGRRSIFRLLDTAVSLEGSLRTRDWLANPKPDSRIVTRRQTLVRELRSRPAFRDKLTMCATVAGDQQGAWGAQELIDWLQRPQNPSSSGRWLLLLGTLAVVNAGLFVAHQAGFLPPWWQVTFVVYLGLVFARSNAMTVVWADATALHHALRQLRAVFDHLESYGYGSAPHLRALAKPFLDEHIRPSTFVARANRVLAAIGMRGNPVSWFLLNAALPWDLFFAQRLNRIQSALSLHVPSWLDIWFELEALCALANFGYLNPSYAFPWFVTGDESAEPTLWARQLGHPLIPDTERVCNDFAVHSLGEISLVTGSNMAGKSVFLKTVGVNCALANAGAPVNAQEFRVAMFRLYTSMRVADSVTDGISFFYAEVKRLKTLLLNLECDDALPMLFCIDEIFRGTNNRERLIGSRAYVRALAAKNGVGLIATHDLELAKLADEMPNVSNYHFRDQVTEGRMLFDYCLHRGPCPTTNALAIMAYEGLPVDAAD